MSDGAEAVYPVKPGDWIADASGRVAKVRAVYGPASDIVADLYLYNYEGQRLARQSPALGGPRSFEPACWLKGWHRLSRQPDFPIRLTWSEPDAKGARRAEYHAGDPAPWRTWTPPKRKAFAIGRPDDAFRRALERIAAGDNDARRVAQEALGYSSIQEPRP